MQALGGGQQGQGGGREAARRDREAQRDRLGNQVQAREEGLAGHDVAASRQGAQAAVQPDVAGRVDERAGRAADARVVALAR